MTTLEPKEATIVYQVNDWNEDCTVIKNWGNMSVVYNDSDGDPWLGEGFISEENIKKVVDDDEIPEEYKFMGLDDDELPEFVNVSIMRGDPIPSFIKV